MVNRTLIVDDALIMRKRIRGSAGRAGWPIVGEAGNGEEPGDLRERKRASTIFGQDAECSVVHGMPEAVAEAGMADRLLSLRDMPREILNHRRV
jgi:two-component system chemotaxis response regulator CheB